MEGKIYEAPPDISDSNRRIIETGPTKRVYQVWKGSNRFLLGGRLIFGPEVRSLVFTIFLIVVPVILFAAFVSPSLVGELEHDVWNIIVVIAATLTVHVLFLLFLTSSRDPGIVPRNRRPPELDDENEAANWDDFQDNAPALPPTKDVLVNGNVVKVKYCHTCMLYRPPRCSHCSICNNCVEHFDHHCPWVGQCIGKRNYRFFFMFVSSTTILCLYIFALCWVNLKREMEEYRCNFWEAVCRSPVSAILIIYTFVAAWFVGGLTAFHMYLICTNQTTYENFRYRYDGKMNPYNRGCTANVKETFFSQIPRSKHNFRAKVKEDFTYKAVELDVDKTNIDLEMGGKRQAVAAEEFEEIQNQIGSMRATERCGTQPAHEGWGDQKSNWEITSDIQALSAELGMGSFRGRERNTRYH